MPRCVVVSGSGRCSHCGATGAGMHMPLFGTGRYCPGHCPECAKPQPKKHALAPVGVAGSPLSPSTPRSPAKAASQWRDLGFGAPRSPRDGLPRDRFYVDTPQDRSMRSRPDRNRGWIPRRPEWFAGRWW